MNLTDYTKTTKPFNGNDEPIMLGTKILSDKKVAFLSDHLWRRFIEIMIVTGNKSRLPEIGEIAWHLHVDEDELEDDISCLINKGLLVHHDHFKRLEDKESADKNVPYGCYLIKSQLGYYKIGFSSNVNRRFETLNKATPDSLKLIHVIKTWQYRDVEKYLHDKFEHKRYDGEWFKLSDEDVDYIKSYWRED